MPSQTNTRAAGSSSSTAASKRFELPALDFKFGSLTDGTDIPPPLPSPIQEEEPDNTPQPANKQQQQQHSVTTTTNGQHQTTTTPSPPTSQLSRAGTKRRAEDNNGPTSPTLSSRPGSIRRLFSRNLLNTAYANGDISNGSVAGTPPATANGQQQQQQQQRPPSRGGDSTRRVKRSSGWFGRLRTNEAAAAVSNSQAAAADDSQAATADDSRPAKAARGPPPPMIPELSELNSRLGIATNESGFFGSDLFKDIK